MPFNKLKKESDEPTLKFEVTTASIPDDEAHFYELAGQTEEVAMSAIIILHPDWTSITMTRGK